MPTIRKNTTIPQNRPPRLRRIPRENRGPKELRLWVEPERQSVGPGDPPGGFVTGTTSASEWPPYWALAKIFNDPPDPRQPPFQGGQVWGYQVSLDGGRSTRGGSVADYVVWLPSQPVVIRLVTERFHLATNALKKAADRRQAMNLERFARVADLYEQDIIADQTGEAVIRHIVELLGGRERINPATAGTFRRVRPNTI
jgi:hypothetical protein